MKNLDTRKSGGLELVHALVDLGVHLGFGLRGHVLERAFLGVECLDKVLLVVTQDFLQVVLGGEVSVLLVEKRGEVLRLTIGVLEGAGLGLIIFRSQVGESFVELWVLGQFTLKEGRCGKLHCGETTSREEGEN